MKATGSNPVESTKMSFLKSLIILTLISFVVGQVLRLQVVESTAAVTATDFLVVITDSIFLIYAVLSKKQIKLSPQTFLPVIFFTFIVAASNTLATLSLDISKVVIASLFLIRFLSYFFVSQIVLNVIKKDKIVSWFNLILLLGLVFILAGIFQLIFFPDLTPLVAFGWDPHQRRIVSTFLDPNFSGYVYSLIFAFATLFFIDYQKLKMKNVQMRYLYLGISVLSAIALVLTFSRSSYLAFLAVAVTIGIFKSKRIFTISLIFLMLAFLLVGQFRERVIGAFMFDDTARARVESWQNALTIFTKSPVLGVGFNTYRYVQAKENIFEKSSPLGGHSGAGTDSSLLLILATTGAIGFSIYAALLWQVFKVVKKGITKSPIKLATFASFLALIVHSQFVNSMLFPQIMLLFWVIVGLSQVHDS